MQADSNFSKGGPRTGKQKSPFGGQFQAFLPENDRHSLSFEFCAIPWATLLPRHRAVVGPRCSPKPFVQGVRPRRAVNYHACMPLPDASSPQTYRPLNAAATAFTDALSFSPTAETVGNLTVGRGALDGRDCLVALVESRTASGAVGRVECDRLASVFKVAAAKSMPLALYLDSAGARVSEGLPALGAFRAMFTAAARAKLQGCPMMAVLGTYCFGGASMLAALCDTRVFQASTRLAMSGPSILAAAAGMSALDDMFRAIAEVSIGAAARTKLDPSNTDQMPATWAQPSLPRERMDMLAARLSAAKLAARGDNASVTRRDLALLYPNGVDVREVDGLLVGKAAAQEDSDGEITILGSVDKRPMGAARVQGMLNALQSVNTPRLHVLMDCDAHSGAVDDEKVMLSSYLAELTLSLLACRARGVEIEVIVLGKLGGGIYLALAAGCTKLSLLYGAEIQLLPGKAIAAILGEANDTRYAFEDYRMAGVADAERKIGLV